MSRKTLFIVLILIILTLSFGLFAYFYFISSEDNNFISFEGEDSDISIISLYPPNEAQNVGIHQAITVQFSRSLTPEEQKLVSFTSNPPLSVSYEWKEDAKNLTLEHTQPLWSETEYSFQISYPYSFFSWNITTQLNEDIPLEDIINSQSEADRYYGSWMKSIQENHPWYDDLPLTTSDYYVYFDVDKDVFVAKIYIKPSSSVPEEDQFRSGQDEVIRALSELSIQMDEYEIEWVRREVQ